MTFATLATIHKLLVNNFDVKESCYKDACRKHSQYFNIDDFDRNDELKEAKSIAYDERCAAYNALTDFENHDFT